MAYTKTTNFATKDSTNDIIKGTEIDTEFNNIATAVAINDAHIVDATAAHAASAISYAGGTGISATDVEAAIDELANEKAATGANGDITSLTACTSITAGTVTVATGDLVYVQDVSAANVLKVVTAQSIANLATIMQDYFSGCVMSTAGSSATMSIAAGQVADSTNAVLMSLTAIAKTTSAWSVGTAAGGLDTGAIANSTWYHFYVIRRPDTGVVDVVFSTSASSPTLPANYTQFRRIGAGKTDGAAQWFKFIQTGNIFEWDSPTLDINVTNPGTAAVLRVLNVPTGITVLAKFNYASYDPSNANQAIPYFSNPLLTDLAPSLTSAPLGASAPSAPGTINGLNTMDVVTDTSAQIRTRVSASSVASILRISTLGWTEIR